MAEEKKDLKQGQGREQVAGEYPKGESSKAEAPKEEAPQEKPCDNHPQRKAVLVTTDDNAHSEIALCRECAALAGR